MPLELQIDNLDAVPEAIRSLYVPHGDKFKLDVSGIEDTSGLKSALDKERKSARELERQATQWRALGKTPEEIQALVDVQTQTDADKLAKSGEWDKLRAQMNDTHAKDIAAMAGTVAAKDAALSKYLVDSQATTAIASAKGVPELLLPHVRASVKVVEENGTYTVCVIDASGNPRVNGKGEFLSITDLVSEMRQSAVFGRAFESSGANGGGASNGISAGQKTMTQSQFLSLTPIARAKAMASGMTLTD